MNNQYPDNPPQLPKKEADLNTEVRVLFSYILGITESVNEDSESELLYKVIKKVRVKVANLLGQELED